MKLLAIDPGSEQSAMALLNVETMMPVKWGKEPNERLLRALDFANADVLAIEMVASYGMAVGADVFETCVWAGRFIERWTHNQWTIHRPDPTRVYRREVKLHLCGSPRAKDTNIRHALIDRYGPGRDKAVGTKRAPGPLHGMKADCWQALAVAITVAETVLPAEDYFGMVKELQELRGQ